MKRFFHKELLEVGVDEVARGCLAGPVFSAAVIWPKEIDDDYIRFESQIRDSKKLSRKKRHELRGFIEEVCLDFYVNSEDNRVIDKINILNATQKAMHGAIDGLNIVPEHILVDGHIFTPYYYKNSQNKLNNLIENTCIKGGDNKYIPIACASILAKEYHDDYIKTLCERHTEFEKYDWNNNMCYGTQKHIEAIKKYGLTEYHRRSFGICKNFI